MATAKSIRLLHIMTVPLSLRFLEGQISFIRSNNIELQVLTSPGTILDEFSAKYSVQTHAVDMPRKITPFLDIAIIWKIYYILRQTKLDIVHAHTPKAGLLGMIAAWFARVPIRIYHMRGLPFLAATGKKRQLLRMTEYISCKLAHRVICNSKSNLEIAIKEGLCSEDKIMLLHNGSGNGVDATQMFDPKKIINRDQIRSIHGLLPDSFVIGFVGRIVEDKGVNELIAAWQRIKNICPQAYLLLVGPFELQNPITPATKTLIADDSRIISIGFIENKREISLLYASMDLVVLPSYREGFPNVLLEAAAMGLPVVTTNVSGCVDAIVDGMTGTIVPARDSEALAIAVQRYIDDPELRHQHGQAGRERVLRDFRPEDIWQALLEEYQRLLADKGLIEGKTCDV